MTGRRLKSGEGMMGIESTQNWQAKEKGAHTKDRVQLG